MIKVFLYLVLCVSISSIPKKLWATNYYAATDGTTPTGTWSDTNGDKIADTFTPDSASLNSGSYTKPWSIEYAVGKVKNGLVKPGDTVIFKSGTYFCNDTITSYNQGRSLEFKIAGTPTAKITFRPEKLWGFSFDGGILLTADAHDIVVKNFRIFNSESTERRKTVSYTFPPGINAFGEGVELLHNLIENTGHPGIGSWSTTNGKYIAGNIIRFVGIFDFTEGYTGSPRGSGMYLQNRDNSREALIEGNISYFNHTTGMKAYGNTNIWGFKFKHQICAENHEAGIFYHQDDYPSTGVDFIENYIWQGNTGIRAGYVRGRGGHRNAIMRGNYIVDNTSPFSVVNGWENITVTENTAINPETYKVWTLEVADEVNGNIQSHHFSRNRYYSAPVTRADLNPFFIKDSSKNFSTWQQTTGQDHDSAWSMGLPTELKAFTFRPTTDPDFVHVAVFNWPLANETWVDLRDFFKVGDTLELFDAQAIPHSYKTVNYSGGSIALDLKRTEIAPMLGSFANDTWHGFNPKFRAFVIHRVNQAPTPPTNLHISVP